MEHKKRTLAENMEIIRSNHNINNMLERFGIDQDHNRMFSATWRNEKTASCKVLDGNTHYYDHGIAQRGDVVDLFMNIVNVDFNTAIGDLTGEHKPLFVKIEDAPVLSQVESKTSKVLKVKPLTSKTLLNYMKGRGISMQIAKRYCNHINYQNSKGKFYAIGFENDKGGFELRSESFKGCTGSKSITILNSEKNKCVIFEGFTDFLSAIMLTGNTLKDYTCIILNSTSLVKHVRLNSYKYVLCLLDNDKSGTLATNKLRAIAASDEVMFRDVRVWLSGLSDVNEKLIKSNNCFL